MPTRLLNGEGSTDGEEIDKRTCSIRRGTYLLYVSTLGISQGSTEYLSLGATSADTYAGGSFYFTNVGVGSPVTHTVSELNSANSMEYWQLLLDFGSGVYGDVRCSSQPTRAEHPRARFVRPRRPVHAASARILTGCVRCKRRSV
jgi:hypothetical protein